MEKYLAYLDRLRESGTINMLGAAPCLQAHFFELSLDPRRAREVLQAWMDSYRTEGS